MNRHQRIVLGIATCIMALIILFPPWLFVFNPPPEGIYRPATRPAGYHLLLSPHRAMDSAQLSQIFALGLPKVPLSLFTVVIDKERLTIQTVGLLIIATLLIILLKDKRPTTL